MNAKKGSKAKFFQNLNPVIWGNTKRRQYIIPNSIQVKYALVMEGLFLLAALVVWWEVFKTLEFSTDIGLKELKKGDFTHRIHLRKKDEFKSIELFFNDTVESLQKKAENNREKIKSMVSGLEGLMENCPKKSRAKINKMIATLDSIANTFKT